ncbi:hypothetical protein [Microbacterium sp. BH-3-3-3]|uniref:hypothetical protein n=1 Tax=Microbacterium sp. BH-3-3-3 TaxID=1906742 RepID=UPI0011A1EE2E|nr:hypothetical protein [Microbacterium sp. BH-3-3-3]
MVDLQTANVLVELAIEPCLGLAVVGATHQASREQAAGLAATFDGVKSATGDGLGAILQGQAFGRGSGSTRSPQAAGSSPAVVD